MADTNIQVPAASLGLDTSQTTTGIISPAGNLALSASVPTLGYTASGSFEIPSADLVISRSTPVSRFVITWNAADTADPFTCPGEITVDLITETRSGGRSFTGKKQSVQSDAGFWRIVLGKI